MAVEIVDDLALYVSVLFNEPKLLKLVDPLRLAQNPHVSVLFNEPKLLKSLRETALRRSARSFSALQRAEIAEIMSGRTYYVYRTVEFQCSSTSRNC